MNRTLFVQVHAWRSMQRHVRRRAPLEACGLLAGRDDLVELVIGIRNAARSPVRYLMDPRQQMQALLKLEQLNLNLLGIYHSHPNGPDHLSETDVKESLYAVVQVLWWQGDGSWQASGFWIEEKVVTPVNLAFLPVNK